jgi:molecular chaperone DnaK
MVHQMMERISGKHPNMAIAPDQIVAHGAAIHATITQLTETAVTVTQDGARMITQDALTPFPEKPEEENILDIFRPEVVEAAKKVKLQDVNSHSLGVIVRAGDATRFVNSIVIPVNTPLPTSRSKVFGTEAQNQRLVRIWVVEGETRDPRGCTQIGECVIQDLPKGLPRGSPVDVTFEFDKSGRIHVQAEETTSHTRAEVFLQRGLGFDQVTLDELRNTVTNLPIE